MSEYQEFTGKSVEEAIKTACDAFGVGLADLDFEILTPGSRGVLGMGAEPARIVAAPRSALGGAAPKREAAEATPLPAQAPREDRPYDRDRAPRPRTTGSRAAATAARRPRRLPRPRPRPGSRASPGRPGARRRRRPAPRRPRWLSRRPWPRPRPAPGRPPADRRPAPPAAGSELSPAEVAQVATARGSLAMERAELEAAEATPETLAAGQGDPRDAHGPPRLRGHHRSRSARARPAG